MTSDLNKKILSDITVHMKYAKYLPENERRETWDELCDRNMRMHMKKYPELAEEIEKVYKDFVFTKKVPWLSEAHLQHVLQRGHLRRLPPRQNPRSLVPLAAVMHT